MATKLKKGVLEIITIIDAELAEGKLQRFPNLACMKIASYYKSKGETVLLKSDYKNLNDYEKIYISKVFTRTKVNNEILSLPNVTYGGTGFFYENASGLLEEIEHCFPAYSLYDLYVKEQIEKGIKSSSLKSYVDYSIGFLTRGCFRKCDFCVNKNYDRCVIHSPLNEFYDKDREKDNLIDDNVLAYSKWRTLLEELISVNKPFTFKQGVDIRLMNVDFIKLISKAKYDNEIFFAFDNVEDSRLIEEKLCLFREHSNKAIRMYVFCGYDRQGKYDINFWLDDIENIFKRLAIIGKYRAVPFLMRYEKFIDSPFSGLYKTLASYCNKSGIFKVTSFIDFCRGQQEKSKNNTCSEIRYYNDFVQKYQF